MAPKTPGENPLRNSFMGMMTLVFLTGFLGSSIPPLGWSERDSQGISPRRLHEPAILGLWAGAPGPEPKALWIEGDWVGGTCEMLVCCS